MRSRPIVLAAALVLALTVPATAAVAEVPAHHVTLTGAKEVPGPGDGDGRGEFSWSLDGSRLCYLLSVKRIGTAGAAHIHRGGPDVAGPVKVDLIAPVPRASATCVTIDSDLARALRRHPHRFYVNVHTAAFPGGAIRAQLRR